MMIGSPKKKEKINIKLERQQIKKTEKCPNFFFFIFMNEMK